MNILRNVGLCSLVAFAGFATSVASADQVGLGFSPNNSVPGSETLSMSWSNDPGASFVISRDAAPGIVWDVTLVGHLTVGGGNFAFQPGSTMTWADPYNPGFYSNLTFIDNSHWQLQTMSPVAANTNNGGFGVFPNGTSIYAGLDLSTQNTDQVFASVTVVPAPGAAAVLGLGGLALGRRRR